MYDPDAPEPHQRSTWPMFLLLGLMAVCVIVSILIYLHSTNQPVTLSDSGFSFTKVEADKPAPFEPVPGQRWAGPGIQSGSSLKMVEPTNDESIFGSVAVGTRTAAAPAPPSAEQPAAKAPEAPPKEGEKLTPGEEKVLEGIVGKWSTEKATQVASEPTMIPGLINKLLGYPRIIGVLMNNQFLVKTFMNTEGVRTLCSNKSTMKGFLSDGNSKTGVNQWANMLKQSSRYPGATKTIMESQGASTFLSSCGSVSAVSGDPATISQVMTSNPALASVLPTFMEALSHNPGAKQLYSDVSKLQGSLGPVKN